ncbi:YcjF family protein [Bartonella tamiae]|uniref:TIGR01620 family protein n=1 Tax=Bartonella tamiae Th239 TaxID=1094558 RepID=J0QZV6_9HYPH|nr:TIGR01620 family protein [Bartonella tamiae]EJF88789.1 TIGR01620 family protein [Bartonella tamiae Th239]EJF94961.1 TIGR01620 family protein [Bartonella tamiae Th307]
MTQRKPKSIQDFSHIKDELSDPFLNENIQTLDTIDILQADKGLKRFGWGKLFLTSFSILFIFALGLWAESIVRSLFLQYEALGWVALSITIIAAFSLIIFILSEIRGIFRLRSVDKIRENAMNAVLNDDMSLARKAVDELILYTSHTLYTSKGRQEMESHKEDIIDGKGLIHLAEYHILSPLDREARKLILKSAKRVSIVTTVSPRAIVDLAYVLYETTRLIHSLASLYGARPGRFGFFSLIRRVLTHLAVTGTLAVGDGLVQQFIGQGLARRLSARLGEGVVNGLLTTRIGIATMDVLRPFPFSGQKRPGLSDFTSDLVGFHSDSNQKNYKI